jgi:TrmH family RNA methyltransferase
MKQIRSRDNPQFRMLLKLATSAKERQGSGMMLLDGNHLVEAAHQAGVKIALLAIGESAIENADKRGLFDSIPAEIRLVLSDPLLAMISAVSTASGLVAMAPVPSAPAMPGNSLTWLMLESIQDPGNLGTMLRTAAAAGVEDVALSPGSVSAWSPKVLRAAMGAHFGLRIHEQADLVVLAREFAGTSVATRPDANASLYQADLSGPVAWLFGNEGAGLSAQLSACAKLKVSIPMPGPAESLNVASAAAICLFEQLRQQSAKT